jgi:invasion protein IalB
MHRAVRAACAVAALCCTPALAENAKLLQKYSDWSAYSAPGGAKVCFAVTQPKDQKPKNVKRDPVYFYVSAWPGDQVTNEISVKMGYPFKPGTTGTLTIGSQKFDLFTKDEGAFVEKTETEADIVAALRKGSTMKIDAKSARGTPTSDTYSLSGVSDALDRIAKECGGSQNAAGR